MFLFHVYRHMPLTVKKRVMGAGTQLFRRRLRRHFARMIRPDSLVFDVGAHVGDHTAIFLELGARVVAVEPQPSCVSTLQDRFGKHPKLTIVPRGLSDNPGNLPFYVAANATMNSTFAANWLSHPRLNDRRWEEIMLLPVMTLDALIDQYGVPAFCKIDVEGHELSVLQGLEQAIPQLSFEFDQCYFDSFVGCVRRLETIGQYEYNYGLYESNQLHAASWLTADHLVTELRARQNGYLRGDIYARLPRKGPFSRTS